jgi:hypothetical protein
MTTTLTVYLVNVTGAAYCPTTMTAYWMYTNQGRKTEIVTFAPGEWRSVTHSTRGNCMPDGTGLDNEWLRG